MKLTKTIRDAFVRSALADVPRVDYEEQIRKVALDDIVSQLPPKVRAVWDDPATRMWIHTSWRVFESVTVTVPGNRNDASLCVHLSPKAQKEVRRLDALMDAQKDRDNELRRMLVSAAASVNTRKALVDLLPEFEKYLPADEPRAVRALLPAVAGITTAFMKAGWPKDRKAA